MEVMVFAEGLSPLEEQNEDRNLHILLSLIARNPHHHPEPSEQRLLSRSCSLVKGLYISSLM